MAACQTTPWRLISGILGVACLVLMATFGILLINLFTKQNIQPTSSPRYDFELQEGSGCCSCQEKWIGYQCNCYFISHEQKTWPESKDFCASHNSSLLTMQNGNELDFMNSSKYFYWIGLSYSKEHGAWLWVDGSALSQNQSLFTKDAKKGNCIVYSPAKGALDEPCTNENYFICKQQIV